MIFWGLPPGMLWASGGSLAAEIVDVAAEWLSRWLLCRARLGCLVELLVDDASSADFAVLAVLAGAESAGPSMLAD